MGLQQIIKRQVSDMSSNRILRKTPSVIDWLKKILASFLVLVSLGALIAAPAFAVDKARVKVSSLIVRQHASVKSKRIAVLKKGAIVTVYGVKNNWCKINTGSKTGFVQKHNLQKINLPNENKNDDKNNDKNTDNNNDNKNNDKYDDIPTLDTTDPSDDTPGTLSKGAQGDTVKALQTRLWYLNYLTALNAADGTFGDSTETAVKRFQLQAGLTISGKADKTTQERLNAKDAPRCARIVTKNWFNSNINSLFPRGSTVTVVDCATGRRFRIIRVQGSNHADCEPATSTDTAVFKSIYNGKWSWNARAVILVAKGELVAASLNSMPHGKDFIKSNNFKGQFCLHTTGSKTHGSSCINSNHQVKIDAASKFLQ